MERTNIVANEILIIGVRLPAIAIVTVVGLAFELLLAVVSVAVTARAAAAREVDRAAVSVTATSTDG